VTDQIKKTLGVVLVLVLGVGLWMLYSSVQPTVTRLQDHDPQALEALDLVKHHLSREGYTLEQELQLFVDQLEVKGVPHREEEWQVAAQKDDKYVVRKIVREKGSVEWIEREFAWRVDMKEKSIRVISLAAQQFMPFENLPPLPHGEEISLVPTSFGKGGQFG
jgi:ABC-type nickel/cobalt efflux system permease component RcnA